VDGGAVTLDGGRSVFTAIVGGGSEAVENGGSAFGNLVENGGGLFVPGAGSISGTLIESGGTVVMGNPVAGTGTGNGTFINGGTEDLYASTSEANDLIANGGVQTLEEQLVVVRNAVIDKGGTQTVIGQTFGTVVNDGGLQYVTRGDASIGVTTGTVVNNGGQELLNGGISKGTVINPGGLEDTYSSAQGTIINGGTMIVEAMAETGYAGVTGGIQFTGANGVLELAGTSLTTTTISGFAPTDRIDFLNFGYSSAATATLGANNVLTIQGLTGGTAILALDPTANYSGDSFKLASDGQSGTNLTVTAASAQGDPLGVQAAFTKTAPAIAVPASASGMKLPDATGGCADVLAMLTGAASSGHVQILPDHHTAGMG
jgi:autotransporter passenger strand-loop-strand repeat protein